MGRRCRLSTTEEIVREATSINFEAFGLFVRLITVPMTDSDRSRIGNESLMADLFGSAPIPVPRSSTVDLKVVDLLYKFLDLSQVPHRFKDMETMVRYYPWRGKISRGLHLENCYFLIAHETYILEERIKKFLNCISACAVGREFAIDTNAVTKTILKRHKSFFGNLVAARGIHVHQEANVPRDIKRIGLLELQMLGPDGGIWKHFHRDAINKARKQWMLNAHNASQASQLLIASTLKSTRVVWKTVVDEEVAKLAAN